MPTPLFDFRRDLSGLRISRPWKGYGSAIFLELGDPSQVPTPPSGEPDGVACISIEWDWRLELGSSIVGGSSTSGPAILKCLERLRDEIILSVDIEGEVPEITIRLSSGFVLRTMSMARGNPQWSIRLPTNQWIGARAGEIVVLHHAGETTDEADAAALHAELTASRWGVPTSEPRLGNCKDCRFIVPLDGTGYLLDYGCCTSVESPFDGRAVHHRSGCESFIAADEA